MEEKVTNAEELNEAEIRTSEVEREFPEQKERVDALSKNIVRSAIKLDEAGSHKASMRRNVSDVHRGEA